MTTLDLILDDPSGAGTSDLHSLRGDEDRQQHILLIDNNSLFSNRFFAWIRQFWAGRACQEASAGKIICQHDRPDLTDGARLAVIAGARDHDSVEALLTILAPKMDVVLIGRREEIGHAERWLALGASGVVPDDLTPQQATKALEYVLAGGRFVPCDLAERKALRGFESWGFTPREADVAKLLGKGLPNKLIAYRLEISEATVKVHVRAVLRKLNCNNRAKATFLLCSH